jgi:hypothetical protein
MSPKPPTACFHMMTGPWRSDLGTGKTCLARGIVRGCAGEEDLPVTSPSYLLDNTYEGYDPATGEPFMCVARVGSMCAGWLHSDCLYVCCILLEGSITWTCTGSLAIRTCGSWASPTSSTNVRGIVMWGCSGQVKQRLVFLLPCV